MKTIKTTGYETIKYSKRHKNNLAKVGVASSSLVSRSRIQKARFLTKLGFFCYWGTVTGFPPSTSSRRT